MPGVPESLQQALAERYAIEREVGHGGSATVYLARDLKHKRRVALKVLSRELALAVRTERFVREIEIAARLSHPHIVPLFDSGSADGRLYYVMPHLEGESLRELLARNGPLSVEEALRIAREVADALEHAHRHGVIHRDIKPGNILLEAGHARVADFGIARAVAALDGQLVTQTGVPIGTPAYMSPEQASGARDLDPRTDIYSLGCVLYEMLAGTPPFRAADVEAVLASHIVDPVPSLRDSRPDVPPSVEGLVAVALAKNREERFATADAVAQAIVLAAGDSFAAITSPRRTTRARRLSRPVRYALAVTLAAGALGSLWRWGEGISPSRRGRAAPLDTLRYFILPFEYDSGVVASIGEDRFLHDALARWTGITVVDRPEARERLARRGTTGPVSFQEARSLAAELRAGRYVRGEVSRIGDSMRVHAGLYDAAGAGAPVRGYTVRLGRDLGRADSVFALLADRLLLGDDAGAGGAEARTGTTSLPARQAHQRGLAAVQQWDLPAADSGFVAATRYDPNYAHAHLWLAQVRFWSDTLPATWRSSAERAAAGRAELSRRERALSDALVALGRGEVERACAAFDRLTTREPHEFSAWYGLANCLRRDNIIVRDPGSPSGWRFRSSYHHAIKAYQQAFRLLPSIHKAFRTSEFESVRTLLMTSTLTRRRGRAAPPDTTTFEARLAWEGDSLVFVPYRYGNLLDTRPWKAREPPSVAVRRQRELFHEIAASWVAAFPTSPDALEALAISLEMLGVPSAVDTLRRAWTLSRRPNERLRMAANEVWLRLKFSIPDDVPALRTAVRLADSLLRSHRFAPSSEPRLLASLAAVTGRASFAADLGRQPGAYSRIPGPIARSAPAFLAFAALGGPADSVSALEHRVEQAIENLVDPSQRERAREQWLARAATLAFPEHRLASITRLAGQGDFLLDAQAAFLRGDTATVRRILSEVHVVDQAFSPADLTLDALYPEAWLLAATGDDSAAISWLDPSLNALPGTAPSVFSDPARAGALVRAMTFRAELAERQGDRDTARRWARAVTILWSKADEFLKPLVSQMERLNR